ncbi:MAG: diphosphomevalonate decarboxylase [Anaerolineales bacterium]|nr:diphosphomevalonate decarboxylase [Anaerolineales bacterium]
MFQKAAANGCSNIAFIKYWGNRDDALRIPLNNSISMNLDHAATTTTVAFDDALDDDHIILGGARANSAPRARVVAHLDRVRALAQIETRARVESQNNFPMGAGIASSASAFAALSLAATRAIGLELPERELSILARQGSGSACRSIPGGFVEWLAGSESTNSYAVSIAPPTFWVLRDVIAIVSTAEKKVGSTDGHHAAPSSHFLTERLNALPARLARVRRALFAHDLAALGSAIEEDAIELHFVAMTSAPPIFYWSPEMVRVIESARAWRADGLAVYFTLDAGPNVHLICEAKDAVQVAARAREIPDVQQVIVNAPGGPARLTEEHLF